MHYYRVVLAAVPRGCRDALDVGCGDGTLVRLLAAQCPRVTGIDRSAAMVDRARVLSPGLPGVAFTHGNFLDAALPSAGYDLVTAVASLHHLDLPAALGRADRLLRPGGVLAVVGLARNATPVDWLVGAAGLPANWAYRALRGDWCPGAPVQDPTTSWSEVRAAFGTLPGARYRRHLLWRYSVVWRKPANGRSAEAAGTAGHS